MEKENLYLNPTIESDHGHVTADKVAIAAYGINLTSPCHLKILLCFCHGFHTEGNSVLHGNGKPDK